MDERLSSHTRLTPIWNKVGYSTVAINYMTEKLNNIPRADSLKVSEEKIKQLGIRRELRQYSRVTVIITPKTSFTRMMQADIQAYDILAVRPTSDKLFQLAAATLDVDIISFDLTETFDFHFSHKMVKKTRVRRAYFEVCYSPAIRDRSLRRNIFANVSNLMGVRGAQNIIVSSGCEDTHELRSPKDVMNLGMLMGMNEIEAKDAVTTNTRAVILRSYSRRILTKRVMVVERIADGGDEKTLVDLAPAGQDEADMEDDFSEEDDEELTETIEDSGNRSGNVAGNKNKRQKTQKVENGT